MRLKIEFSCDNADFADSPEQGSARVLRHIADAIERGTHLDPPHKVRDINGNTIGTWTFED